MQMVAVTVTIFGKGWRKPTMKVLYVLESVSASKATMSKLAVRVVKLVAEDVLLTARPTSILIQRKLRMYLKLFVCRVSALAVLMLLKLRTMITVPYFGCY
jgi:hypothetical protein